MKSSQTSDNTYDYSTIGAVLVTEFVKLITSICWYLKNSSIKDFTIDLKSNIKLLALYFIPSLLYCSYNNLTYINLRNFDPTTYNLLLQFRVVLTGIIYQSIFRQKLTKWQWFSLIVLTTGCVIKNLGSHGSNQSNPITLSHFLQNLLLLLFQLSCSCVAGVFNEYLLKITGAQLNIGMHNIFMYIDSIICNIVALIYFDGTESKYPNLDSFVSLLKPTVIIVIINNAASGIVTSIFLKKLNSILKTFASAIELILIACLCWILFSIPIDIYTAISIGIIFYAIYLQFKHPIKLNLSPHHQDSSIKSHSKTHHSIDNKNINYTELKNLDEDELVNQKAKNNNNIHIV